MLARRAASFRQIEERRQLRLDHLGPGGRRPDTPVIRFSCDPANVENVLIERLADAGRVEVGAAGEQGVAALRQIFQRLFHAGGPGVGGHGGCSKSTRAPSEESTR